MKQAMKKSAPFQHEGIMSIDRGLRKQVDRQIAKWVDSAKKQGQDIDKMGEQEIKYIVELNKPKPPKVISADSPEGKVFTQGLTDMLDKASGQNVIKTDFGGVMDVVTDTVTKIKTMEPVAAMKEANLVIGRKGIYKNLTEEQSQKILKETDDWIFQRDPADLWDHKKNRPFRDDPNFDPDDFDPENFAQGGRTGFFTGALADTEQGKSMSPGTSHDYSPGQGHRATAEANKQLAEINKFHNMKAASMEWKPPKKSIKDKIGGGISSFFNNPLVRGYAALGTGGASEKLRSAMMAKQLYDKRHILGDEAIEEEVYDIPTMGGITPAYAQGGRTGTGLNYLLGEDDQNSRVSFGLGGFNKARRAFLQLMGGAAAGVGAAKSGLFGLLKGGGKKAVIKDLTSVPIGNAPGMPVWFKPLVNKVIKEGDDVTKKLATGERQIVHNKKLGDPKDVYADEITVTQNLDDGSVRVEYHASGNMGDAPIQLDYKAGEMLEGPIKKGQPSKTKSEFSAVESEPEVVNWDGDIEWSGENVVSKVDDLLTDTTKLETYATGNKPNIKKLLKSEQKKKYVNNLHDDQMEQINYIENKQGHMAPERLIDEPMPDDYASGGRVPLARGLAGLLGE